MSVVLQGQTTFAFDKAIRRSTTYLEKIGKSDQISYLPDTYPQHRSQMSKIDIAVRAKILKAHLEDAFTHNIFTVKITRRKWLRKKPSPVLSITHNSLSSDLVEQIAELYLDDITKHVITKI